ncbi:MAG: FG-GAP-like repeat-containing protein [bacterium]
MLKFSQLIVGVIIMVVSTIKIGNSSTFSDSGIILAGLSASDVAWGDYDNDSDLDIAIIGHDGSSGVTKIFRNDGGGIFTDIQANIEGVWSGDVAWGDYDNDGDLDLAFTGAINNWSGISRIYRNDNGTFNNSNIPLMGLAGGNIAWADYDNDGDLDLTITGDPNPEDAWNGVYTIIYKNIGGIFIQDTSQSLMGIAGGAIAWGDYDNDGDLDLAIQGCVNTGWAEVNSALYRNDNGVLTCVGGFGATGYPSLAWGDYDNDGDLDLISTCSIYRNNNGAFAYVQSVSGNGYSSAWGDYDNDGNLDLVISGSDKTRLFRNDNGVFEEDTSCELISIYGEVAWGNYDNDGDLDLLLTGWTGATSTTRIYQNNISDTHPNSIPSPPGSLSATYQSEGISIFSWDKGTDIETSPSGLYYNIKIGTVSGGDNIISSKSGTPFIGNYFHQLTLSKLYLPKGSYYWSVQTIDTALGASNWSPEQIYEQTHVICQLRISGKSLSPAYVNRGDKEVIMERITFASEPGSVTISKIRLDKTGDAQDTNISGIKLFNDTNENGVYDSGIDTQLGTTQTFTSGSCYFTNLNKIVPPGTSNIFIIYDIKEGAERGRNIGVRLSLKNYITVDPYTYVQHTDFPIESGKTTIANFKDSGINLDNLSYGDVAWGNYDNDGDLDIAMTGYDGSTWTTRIFRNDGAGIFTDIQANIEGISSNDIAWGDYDNDSDLDIAIIGHDGSSGVTKIFRNDGGEIFTDIQANIEGVWSGDVAWGDYDNDGDLDLAFTGAINNWSGISRIYRNDNGTFNNSNIPLMGLAGGNIAWADYDNDGDLDLTITGDPNPEDAWNGVYTIIYKNIGGIFIQDTSQSLMGIAGGAIAWGDYDNDGDLDLAIQGCVNTGWAEVNSALYRNDNSVLTCVGGFGATGYPSLAWGDYDNDGDLDLINTCSIYRNDNGAFAYVQGVSGDGYSSAWGDYDNDGDLDLALGGGVISHNDEAELTGGNNHNTLPLPPTSEFSVVIDSGTIILKWGTATDTETSQKGLYYNVRVGTGPDKEDIISSKYATPLFGSYYGLQNKSLKLTQILPTTYYWSVQTIDAGLRNSNWSTEQEFTPPHISQVIPSQGNVGRIVTVEGKGFGSTELIQIDFGTILTITTVSTDSSGNFATTFTIETQPYGTTSIIATGLISNKTASNFFRILPNILFVSPCEGTVGSLVTIRGNGFGASEGISIYFGDTPQAIQFTSTYAEGSFTTTFTINTQPLGTTTITAIGVNTQAEAMDYFFILPSIIFVSPCDGTVGSLVTIAGNGFGKLEAIGVDFGTTLNVCMISSTMYGSFSAVFTVNTQLYGSTTIVASGFVSGTRVFWYGFKIVPKITQVLPSSGQVGTSVTVCGNGFGTTELVRIEFGNIRTITIVSTNATGEFQAIFTVDSQPIGTTTLIAYGLVTCNYAKSIFIVLPLTTLKITPSLQNIAVGTEFTSQVEIKDVRRMITAKLHLSFNPNILEVQEIGTGTFPQDGMVVKQYDNSSGEIDYFVGLLTGSATGSGVICTLKFKAKVGGTSAVVFDFDAPNRLTRLKDADKDNIPFNKEEALYWVITEIDIKPKDKVIKADESIDYQCIAYCGGLELDITGSTTFTATGGGDFTVNTFLAKYMGIYTIQGSYLGFIGTTSVIITPGTPTTLLYISGNNQVNTCSLTLKEPFIVKVVDKYNNPCKNVEVNWEVIEIPIGATLYSISPTKTTTNVQGTTTSLLTLGTEPPGTYTIHAISTGLQNSPYIFTAHSLRRFGNIAGFCMLDFGTELGTSSQIQVTIIESGKTTTTNENSYFIFEKIPVGTYTLNFDTHGASSKELSGVCISKTQFEDTTYIGTVSLLAGDVNNDGKINIEDWPGLIDSFFKQEGDPGWEEAKNADFNHDGRVDDEDFIILRDNFGKGIGNAKAKMLKPISPTEKIELSFDIETLEGVNIDDLRIGDIIYLKVYIRDVKRFLCGEIHLSFNPQLLEVVDGVSENTYKNTPLKSKMLTEGIQIIPGDYIPQDKLYLLTNKVDNEKGKIDYAVGVMEPMEKKEGILAIVPMRIKTFGDHSKIGFVFDEEENKETMFIERTKFGDEKPVDTKPQVLSDEIIINVPKVFYNLNSTLVYPNPAYKGNMVTFDNLINDKIISLKIFNLAGELIYEKDKRSQNNKITWDLQNKDNEPVASGIYIYFLNDYTGSIKRGKIGVIK